MTRFLFDRHVRTCVSVEEKSERSHSLSGSQVSFWGHEAFRSVVTKLGTSRSSGTTVPISSSPDGQGQGLMGICGFVKIWRTLVWEALMEIIIPPDAPCHLPHLRSFSSIFGENVNSGSRGLHLLKYNFSCPKRCSVSNLISYWSFSLIHSQFM